ncbi:MAG: ABC transporter permease [Candidatus Krumholzibacteria bacterium]|nr:ABC transporter permease [Candidatus Krumholzibacteria bacterium]
MWTTLIREFLFDLKTQKTRVFLTTAAIVWGTMSVVLLLSFGFGLEKRLMEGALNYADAVVDIDAGETSKVFEGLPMMRTISFTMDDVKLLRENIPLVDLISPSFGRWGMVVSRGDVRTTTYGEGVAPAFYYMRHFYQRAGRFIDDRDIIEKRRVVFLGDGIAKELFGSDEPVGGVVVIDALPFTVVGVMAQKVQSSMSNGPDAYRVIMPYSTFMTVYGRTRLTNMLIRPGDRARSKELIRDVRDILGRKYRFDPTDEYAIRISDNIENENIGRKIMLGLNIFFGVIGSLTLIVAGVGVANIMYVVIKERTREIGIKRAVGARRHHIIAQYVAEAFILTGSGGLIGVLLSAIIVGLASLIPDTSGPMQFMGHPIFSKTVAFVTVAILVVIALLAGIFPARKAAEVEPMEALRYE